MSEELKEFIKSKREPIMSCKDLTKHFIGRHKLIPVYLSPTFEKEFNYKMIKIEELQQENQKLKEQLQQKENIINKITNYCKFQIEKEQDKFPKPLESEKWLKGRISAFEEILDNKGE